MLLYTVTYSNDFIKYTNGVQTFSEEHYDLIEPLLDKYGYSFNNGSCTDVGKLRQRGLQVSSHNLSCGYFNEHTDNEVIHIPSMNNALSLAQELLELVQMINVKQQKGRISIIMVGGHYNMAGFDHMALSNYGKSHSLEFSDNQLIETKDTIISKIDKENFDCSIIVGTDPISHLPQKLSKKLTSKPLILIDNKQSASSHLADVILPSSITIFKTTLKSWLPTFILDKPSCFILMCIHVPQSGFL